MLEQFYSSLSYIDKVLLTLLALIFFHLIADFILQTPFIAKYKQKKSWEEYNKSGKYTYDYLNILIDHSFIWSFFTFLPLLIMFNDVISYAIIVIVNMIIHAYIDDLKANKLKINLIVDQTLHIFQIVLSLIICLFIY